jgi:hypothetical protein
VQRAPGHEKFNYFDVANIVPEDWKNEYANPAFDRMTERDAAWMARILARFTPDMVQALAAMGQFSDPTDTAYLATVLEGRLERILERYLTRLSPLADVRVSGDELCATDLAELRRLRPAEAFGYTARVAKGSWLQVRREPGARVCVTVPHGQPYTRVVLRDGVAQGALVAHLYDAGPAAGFTLAGLERTDAR